MQRFNLDFPLRGWYHLVTSCVIAKQKPETKSVNKRKKDSESFNTAGFFINSNRMTCTSRVKKKKIKEY